MTTLQLEHAAPAAAVAAQLITAASGSFRRATSSRIELQQAAAAPPAPAAAKPAVDFSCLNGVRALCSVAVVLFHCYLGVWKQMLPYEDFALLTRHHWFVRLALVGGPIGVDVFLVLTAMFAAYQLVPLIESGSTGGGRSGHSSWRVVVQYWRKRALRLLPAYAIANLFIYLALGPSTDLPPETTSAREFAFPSANCPRNVWLNFLFVQNVFLAHGCGVHLWSLSLQVQFTLAFPLLLCALRPHSPGFRARLAATLGAITAAGTAWRLWTAFSAEQLHLPLGDTSSEVPEMMAYFSLLQAAYFPTGPRVAELAVGALLGLLLRSHSALSWAIRRRGLVSAAALGLQATFIHLLLHWSPHAVPGDALWHPLTTQLYTALLYYGSPFAAILAAVTILALILRSDPIHSSAASVLSAPAFQPLAKLSYCLYLMHEQARLWGFLLLLPAGVLPAFAAAAPVHALAALTAFTLAVTYACAYVMYELIENRFGTA